MIPFPGWRDAGHAMRWARHHHGRALKITRYADGPETDLWWEIAGAHVVVTRGPSRPHRLIAVREKPLTRISVTGGTAPQILGVLAALGHIPDRYAAAYDTGRADGMVQLAEQISGSQQEYGTGNGRQA